MTFATITCLTSAHAEPRDPFSVRKPPASISPPIIQHEEARVITLDPGKPRRNAAIWVATAGGALMTASALISWYTKDRYDRAVERYSDDGATHASRREAQEEGNRMMNIARVYGTGLFVAGVASTAAGIYLYASAPSKVRVERVIVPVVGDGSVGVSASGSF
jgi:hypothetical protein